MHEKKCFYICYCFVFNVNAIAAVKTPGELYYMGIPLGHYRDRANDAYAPTRHNNDSQGCFPGDFTLQCIIGTTVAAINMLSTSCDQKLYVSQIQQ